MSQKQTQINPKDQKKGSKSISAEKQQIDTRTPGGRVLPY